MAEGRRRDQWDRTAAILCITANVNRDERKKPSPWKPSDFHPMETRSTPEGILLTAETMPLLRAAFTGKKEEAK